jgi:hypothetical protein
VANSIIDDMLKDQIPNENPKKKKSTKLFIFIIVLLIIVIILATVAIIYLKKKNEITPKIAFLEYLGKTNLTTVLNFESYNTLAEKLETESSQTSSDVSFSVTSPFLELEDVKLSLNSDNDAENKKSYSEIGLNYLNTDIISLKILNSEDSIGIKSDDIVIKYIGSKYENLGRVLSSISSGDFQYQEELNNIDVKSLLNMQNIIPTISPELFYKYIDAISVNVDDASFSEKTVTLARDSGNIETTEYTMAIDETTAKTILIQMLQILESDDDLLDVFINSFEELGIEKDNVKTQIDNLINVLYEESTDSSRIYTVKVYVYNDLTAKLSINFADEQKIDIDYEYGDKENSAVITVLDVESNDAIEITLTKQISDVSETLTTQINIVEDSDIVGKLTLESNILNNQTSYEIKNKVTLNFMIVNATLDIDSKITFKSVEVEDLTQENCLFLDELNDDTLKYNVDAIEERAEEVINSKIESLSSNTSNNYSTIIEQPENLTSENTITQDEARQKVYDSVASAMAEAESRGEVYTILDIQNLEIPDSTYSISVNDNIAIVIVDGYEFTIDSEFHLSN